MICRRINCSRRTGYPLWAVSNESTTFILLIGVCWELSMMFSLAGIISLKMLPVFITTYIPFFLAANYVPDMEPIKRKVFLITEWALVAVLLAALIPLGVI